MKCDDLQQRLDDYLDGDLDTILVSMLEKHIVSCECCNTKVAQAKLLQAELKQFANGQHQGEHPLRDEFITSAFEKLKAHYPEQQTKTSWAGSFGLKTGFVTALAAGFSFWAVLTTFILPNMNSTELESVIANNNQTIVETAAKSAPEISILNLNINETRIVRIAIDTQDEFEKVTFSVILPNHVELQGHKNKQEISWDSKLAKGNNILRIPLKAIKYGQGELIARMTHNGKVKTFKLFLKADKPDLSNLQLLELQV